jgi:hypothetical protein
MKKLFILFTFILFVFPVVKTKITLKMVFSYPYENGQTKIEGNHKMERKTVNGISITKMDR